MEERRLLVIDDEPDICESIRRIAENQDFEVVTTLKADAFDSAYDRFQPNIIIIDIVMPEVDGVELLKWLAERRCTARIVMMTGYSQSYLSKAIDLGHGLGLPSVSSMQKPLSLEDLRTALVLPDDTFPQPRVAAARPPDPDRIRSTLD